MFRKLILQFREEFAHITDEMHTILDSGDVEAGKLRIHNLKGVAGNIGAMDLYSAAELFEQALKCCASDNFQNLMEDFEISVRQVLESASALEEAKSAENADADSDADGEPDMEKTEPLLLEISRLIQKNDLVEDHLLADLDNCLGSRYRQHCKQLEACIGKFDYENAISVLSDLGEALNISGSNGFCGFRYDPQMNADERRQTLTACAAGQSAGASAFICGLQRSQLSEILCNHKIR